MKLQASRKRFTIVLASLIGFVSLGLAPAYAVDERVVDVVAVTWPGAVAPAGDVNAVSKVIDTEVNADWLKFTAMYGAPTDRVISFKTGQILKDPISLISKMACQGIAASDFMNSIRPEAYKRLGITDYSKRYLVVIAPKQTPVINRLHETMNQALAYAGAIRDNAQDDGQPIPLELVASFQETYQSIVNALAEAASV
mgnify:CR=1 FL=1